MKKYNNNFPSQNDILESILKNKRNDITKTQIKNINPNKITVPLNKENQEKKTNNQQKVLSQYEEDTSNSMKLTLEKKKEEVIKGKKKEEKKEENQNPEPYQTKFIDKSIYIHQKYKEVTKKQTEEIKKSLNKTNQYTEEN